MKIGAISKADGTIFEILAERVKDVHNATVSRKFETPPEILLTHLSFTHIREILSIADPMERFFYELECIKGTWNRISQKPRLV